MMAVVVSSQWSERMSWSRKKLTFFAICLHCSVGGILYKSKKKSEELGRMPLVVQFYARHYFQPESLGSKLLLGLLGLKHFSNDIIFLSLCLNVLVHLSVSSPFCLFVYLSSRLSVFPSLCLSVFLSYFISVHISFLTLFLVYFNFYGASSGI